MKNENDTGIIGYSEKITSRRMPQCFRCIHFFGKRNCKAFPDKYIPRGYLNERVKHTIAIGNQIGDYVYEVKDKFKEEDEKYNFREERALLKLESNKKELPAIMLEKFKDRGGNMDTIEKIELKASGPLRLGFDLKIEFFPKEELVYIYPKIFDFHARKIIEALQAKSLEPSFKLTIFKNEAYQYEYF